MTNEPHERQMDGALARLRDATAIPPVDPEREDALLEAFDAHWAHSGSKTPRAMWVTTAAAASIAIGLALGRLAVSAPPAIGPSSEIATVDLDTAGFVPWPGAHGLPPLESGELRRIELPLSELPALGLLAPPSAIAVVQADVVFGQDGLARAVRLVQLQ